MRTAEAELDREALAELPKDLEPTMRNAWSAFALLYRKTPAAKRDADWIALMRKLNPGKLQVRFTAGDWSDVIERLKARAPLDA